MLTIANIAETVGLPPSTTRDYIHRFKYYFKSKNVAGSKHPKYTEDAVEVLKEILKGYKAGLSTEELQEELETKFPYIVDSDEVERSKNSDSGERAGKSSLDIVSSGQVQIFQATQNLYQAIQGMAQMQVGMMKQNQELIRQNNKLMEKMISLLEKPEKPIRVEKATRTKKKPRKATTRSQKPQKKSFLSQLFGG